MASKLETMIAEYLDEYLKDFDVTYEREVGAGFGSRYDFYIPLDTPICIEADGIQHEIPNEFFFKTVDAFSAYKANDNFKNQQANAGEIYLIRISDEITYEDFQLIMKDYDDLLREGVSERYATETEKKSSYENNRRDYDKSQKEKGKAFRAAQYKKFKEQRKASQGSQKKN